MIKVEVFKINLNRFYVIFLGYCYGVNEGYVYLVMDNGNIWMDLSVILFDIFVNDIV